jgi:nucleoside-diphosphate-sugar epimerase
VVTLDDVVDGLDLVLARGQRGARYLLAESAWRLEELLRAATRAAGTRAPLGSVPGPLWHAIVGAAWVLDRLRPAERVTPESLALLGMHFRFEARRARGELGWRPRPFGEALPEIVAALAGRGRA